MYIDDASDYTVEQKSRIKSRLNKQIVIFNQERKYSVYNACFMLQTYVTDKNAVILTVDADDWLGSRETLGFLAGVYMNDEAKTMFTYGGCRLQTAEKASQKLLKSRVPFLNTDYSKTTILESRYRQEPFRVFHAMSFRYKLFELINETAFKEPDGRWLRYCFDLAAYLPMLEMAAGRYRRVRKTLYVYNLDNPSVNIRANPYEFVREELIIRKKIPYAKIN